VVRGDSGVTLNTVERYFEDVSRLLAKLAKYFDTTAGRASLDEE
jgi:hypothetical protein